MNQDERQPEQEAPEAPEKEQEEVENQEEGQETELEEASEKTAEDLAAEIEHLKEQVLRAMAESENTRRRMTKELEDARKYSVSNFAKEMLTVSDNFRRALDAVPADKAEDETVKNLKDGVEATERQLLATLDRFGIKQMDDPTDKPFDPHMHQVMMEQEDLSKPAGTVIQVLQQGYMIHDRLLREAMVVVAKGGAPVTSVDTEA